MNVAMAVLLLLAACWLAIGAGGDDADHGPGIHEPSRRRGPGTEPWDTRDAFRPGTGRFGSILCPTAMVVGRKDGDR